MSCIQSHFDPKIRGIDLEEVLSDIKDEAGRESISRQNYLRTSFIDRRVAGGMSLSSGRKGGV
jgi:hypothetical protein